MKTASDYGTDYEIKWCPGCGNFTILEAMKEALAKLDIPENRLLLVGGIGQAGKTPHYLNCHMFHGLHGRALPAATGARIADHELTVIVHTGDGDCYGEGGNHFLAAIRRNVDLVFLVHNNQVYGLTKGQASPTSQTGMVTKMQSAGVVSRPFNGPVTALAMGAGFVARAFSGNEEQLTDLICRAAKYKGFAMIDILQPCVSFNRINTFSWYQKRVYDITGTGHDPADFDSAWSLLRRTGEQIPTGVLFEQPDPVPFHEKLKVFESGPLINQAIDTASLKAVMESLN